MPECRLDGVATAVVVGESKKDLRRVEKKDKDEVNDLAELSSTESSTGNSVTKYIEKGSKTSSQLTILPIPTLATTSDSPTPLEKQLTSILQAYQQQESASK